MSFRYVKIIFLSVVVYLTSQETFASTPCQLEYQGVVGAEPHMVGIVLDVKSGKSLFLKPGSILQDCWAQTVSVSRNHILLNKDGLNITITPQGSTSTNTASSASKDMTDQLEEQLKSSGTDAESAFQALVTAGEEAVSQGIVTSDEVQKIIREVEFEDER